MTEKWYVDIIESERGWGQSLIATHEFDTKEEAEAFVKEENKDLAPGPAPDYYIIARPPYQKNHLYPHHRR